MSRKDTSANGSRLNSSRRTFLRATGATGALAAGVGAGLTGSAAGGLASFDHLSVNSSNNLVNESGETFKLRGLNMPDPKRLAVTKNIRGKTADQIVDLLTNNEKGFYPRAIRVPAQPTDIGEHPNGNTGPQYGSDSPEEIADDREKQLPPQPVDADGNKAFTRDELITYLETYYDDVVKKCKERGVYCIVDFHRHWHEQPPGNGEGNGGPTGSAAAENHLPYNSKYTLYWAYNTYYGKDEPSSWGYVDQKYRNNNKDLGDAGYVSKADLRNTNHPYDKWEVNQELVDEAVMFWDVVAQRYADEPHVIFEPYNEPTAPGIWGGAQGTGCGAFKQASLWNTYIDDFATPIMNKVREHAPEKHMMMGLPGWCQATQGLYFKNFNEAGFDNVSAVWHNYAGHDVSDEQNWMNDTDYEYIESEEYEQQSDKACYGWAPYEAQGLQEAQSIHHISVTEFGWQDPKYTNNNSVNPVDISKWLEGPTTGTGTTAGYGKPFLDAIEPDDRISWVAWCADPRWLTAMFQVDFPIAEKTLSLTNGSWYETPESDYPVNCAPEDMPCDWKLWQDPNMGQHIVDRLADNKNDRVPFDFEAMGGGTTPSGEVMDLNDTGGVDFDDVVLYNERRNSQSNPLDPAIHDYNDNQEAGDFDDLVEIFAATQ